MVAEAVVLFSTHQPLSLLIAALHPAFLQASILGRHALQASCFAPTSFFSSQKSQLSRPGKSSQTEPGTRAWRPGSPGTQCGASRILRQPLSQEVCPLARPRLGKRSFILADSSFPMRRARSLSLWRIDAEGRRRACAGLWGRHTGCFGWAPPSTQSPTPDGQGEWPHE